MTGFPEAFEERMRGLLGPEYEAFRGSLEEERLQGLRANGLKASEEGAGEEFQKRFQEKFQGFGLSPVPWAADGFYYSSAARPGKSPFHEAGAYYIQEPSAMAVVSLLDPRPGERVLDLCAAPGGKTSHAASRMGGRGLLVSNEIHPARARILSQNVERMGCRNAVVTCQDPAGLTEYFPEFFDKIIVDAPCSGEGMFRKDQEAREQWSPENVALCAGRQRQILHCAAAMLRPGGMLVYSTCTFERGENEGQIADFLARHAEFSLVKQELLLPHEVRGEGHFAAVLEKRTGAREDACPHPVRRVPAAERAYAEFAASFFAVPPEGSVTALEGGRMFLLPAGMPALPVRTLRAGVELGTFDGKRFTPAHALAMAAKREELARFVSLSAEEAERYLRGETLPCEAENGWCAVGYGGCPLGLGKAVNGILKNHYPKGLRKM